METARGYIFSDHKAPMLSSHNLTCGNDLKRVAFCTIDLPQFGANFWRYGQGQWKEFNWLGRNLRIGNVTLHITERIDRCGADTMIPDVVACDLNIAKFLQKSFNHTTNMDAFYLFAIGGSIHQGKADLRGARVT